MDRNKNKLKIQSSNHKIVNIKIIIISHIVTLNIKGMLISSRSIVTIHKVIIVR